MMLLAPSAAMSENSFTILGTQGGPIPIPTRSQPANLLRVGDVTSLVDAGDATAHQMFKAGVMSRQVDNIFVSHLHGDHIGGIFAVLALRAQTNPAKPLNIYGPPGTEHMVSNLVEALAPSLELGYGDAGDARLSGADLAVGKDIRDGESLSFPGFTVKVINNTHYFGPEAEENEHFQSLSYRFELEDRAIVYTGDTGPSKAVEELAKGADLLVAEVMEVDAVVALIKVQSPDLSVEQLGAMKKHLEAHHLTPEQLGELAATAGVPKLVVTHIGTNHRQFQPDAMRQVIATQFGGEIVIANDLDKF